MTYSTKKQTVLITGGSLGIGLELAKQFAQYGNRLILVSKPLEELKVAKRLLETQFSCEVIIYSKDLISNNAALEVYEWTKSLGFEIDILINNAGIGTGGFMLDIPIERELEMMALNTKVVYELTRLFVKDMYERNSGRIMNVASIAAFQPSPLLSTYAATKAFVFSFTMGLQEELKAKKSRVHVMALCPPPAKTGFGKAAGLDDSPLFESAYVITAEKIAKKAYIALMEEKRFIIPDRLVDVLVELGNRLAPMWLKLKLTYNVMHKGKIF
jgi:uncharacterized protein